MWAGALRAPALTLPHIILYTPNVTRGAHKDTMEVADPVWSTLGAHERLMGDKITDFQKNGAHDPHMEDSTPELLTRTTKDLCSTRGAPAAQLLS